MAKDLTWFKFNISKWMMGRIQRETDNVQTAFLRISCKYWLKACEYSSEDAIEECDEDIYHRLVKKKFITENNGFIKISFMDELMGEIIETSNKNRQNALKRWHNKDKK